MEGKGRYAVRLLNEEVDKRKQKVH
jgi:hypothetical protein